MGGDRKRVSAPPLVRGWRVRKAECPRPGIAIVSRHLDRRKGTGEKEVEAGIAGIGRAVERNHTRIGSLVSES